VRVVSSKWWYCIDDVDNDAKEPIQQQNQDEESSYLSRGFLFSKNPCTKLDNLIDFHMVPIVKRYNYRKHNSHQWFFDGICEGLNESVEFVFLTDCGTTYKPSCLSKLIYELIMQKDLIGVTARQRIEWPSTFFHPCEDAPFSFLKGKHKQGFYICLVAVFYYYCFFKDMAQNLAGNVIQPLSFLHAYFKDSNLKLLL
jgi:hypothetical protein